MAAGNNKAGRCSSVIFRVAVPVPAGRCSGRLDVSECVPRWDMGHVPGSYRWVQTLGIFRCGGNALRKGMLWRGRKIIM